MRECGVHGYIPGRIHFDFNLFTFCVLTFNKKFLRPGELKVMVKRSVWCSRDGEKIIRILLIDGDDPRQHLLTWFYLSPKINSILNWIGDVVFGGVLQFLITEIKGIEDVFLILNNSHLI